MNVLKEWLEIYKVKLITMLVILLLSIYFYVSSEKKEINITKDDPPLVSEEIELEQEVAEEKEEVTMMVDVKGAVMDPGVYHADLGERVIDLIKKAGGFTTEANQDQVNLSQHIEDEMVIFVPKIGEEGEPAQFQKENQDSNKVNINKASESELQTLPGIGPSKAMAIIEYRETNGGFKTIADLKEISGIGEKTFEKLEAYISVK